MPKPVKVNELTVLQMHFSTADDEANYFTGNPIPSLVPNPGWLPAGTYRVIDGQLYRVLPGISPRVFTSHIAV